MTDNHSAEDREQQLVSFFKQMDGMGGLLRAVTGDRFSMAVEFRPSGNRVLMDLDTEPMQVETGKKGLDSAMTMSGTPEDLHDLFLGRIPAAAQLDRRKLLLDGGMLQISRFFPLLDMTPTLYGSHLASPQKNPKSSLFQRFLGLFAFLGGLILGRLRRDEIIRLLGSMARGMGRNLKQASRPPADNKPPDGPVSIPKLDPDHPLAPDRPGIFRRFFVALFSMCMFVNGYLVGFFKHRLKFGFNPFGILARMSDGIQRAAARNGA